MGKKIEIAYYRPDVQGIFPIPNGYRFAIDFSLRFEKAGLLLYFKDGEEMNIPASDEGKRGTLYGFEVTGKGLCECSYLYYMDEDVFTDPYAKGICGLEKWGDFGRKDKVPRGRLICDIFDWGEEKAPAISWQDTILYGLNVRAFTMHKSSGVKKKGTFEGIIEKIPYLKELGITTLELMPAYEYEECMVTGGKKENLKEAVENCTVKAEEKLNCWGFTEGHYFAPKASYAADKPEISFKKMVKALHANNLEVMMHFYFVPGLKQSYMLDVLKYWVTEYHIDGFRLSGFQIPYLMIAQEPLFKELKIRSDYFNIEEIYAGEIPAYRNLLADNGNFKNDMRRFLKGDENLLNQVIAYQKCNPASYAVVNALTDYHGFSLCDLVSYDRKHNEANGEENRDGTDYNYSWNCGVEGESRKKAIMELRMRQMKNALCFLFLSQGVPFLFAGDEFGNTRNGNNNAYCQDNETGFIKWKENQTVKELLSFTKDLITLRRKHNILHKEKECQIIDTLGCGYPELSYHGTEAWRPDVSYISRMIGIMLCGKYAERKEEASLYLAYNMHWEKHELGLPKLDKGYKWSRLLSTKEETAPQKEVQTDSKIQMPERCVCLYISTVDETYRETAKKTKKKAGR